MTLRELAALAHEPERAGKGDLPMLKLAQFGDNKGRGKALRNDENVVSVSGIEGDHDAGTMTVADAEARLRAVNIAGLIYTTPSHTAAAPRWRVVVPTSRPLPADERERLCARLNGAMGGTLAGESFNLSQAYYYGRVAGGSDSQIELVDGRAIDVAAELDSRAIGRAPTGDKPTEADLLARVARAEQIHESLCALIGLWCARGDTSDDCEQAARDAIEQIGEADRDRRWQARARDIPRIVRDIFKRDDRVGRDFTLDFDDEPEEPAAAPGRLRFLTPDECAAAPMRGYVVKGLLAPGDVACIFGAPGAGKSLISPHLGYAVAQGRPAFGMRTKPGSVFYVAAEDPQGMRGRVTALKLRHGGAGDFALVEGVSDLLKADSADLKALRAAVDARLPSLIFVDTLAMAFPGLEENNAEDMGRVVAVARQLAMHGAAVVLIHHDTKAQTPTPRGHSLLNGALDIAVQLFPQDENGIVRGRLTKNRNGTCARDIAFRIATEALGFDEDDEPVTAALVAELSPGSAPKREKLTASESAALAILHDLEAGGAVTEDAWRAACIEGRSVSAAEDRDSRRKATKRAFEGLARKGAVDIDGGLVVRPATQGNAFDDGGEE